MAALTLWTTSAVRTTTEKVRAVNDVSARWNAVSVHLTVEDAALREFLATGGTSVHRDALVAVVGSATADLNWLEHEGSSAEAAYVQMLRPGYADYTRVIQAVLRLTPNSDQLRDYGTLATVDYAPLRDQVAANVNRQQRELTRFLIDVDQKNMTIRWITVIVLAFSVLCCCASVVVLISYQRKAEQEAETSRDQALHDALTGLANRTLLDDRIDVAIRGAEHTARSVGLLLVDLDRFKEVNDTLGHHSGDLLLQQVADRLTRASRGTDTVARLGETSSRCSCPTSRP